MTLVDLHTLPVLDNLVHPNNRVEHKVLGSHRLARSRAAKPKEPLHLAGESCTLV